MKCPESSDAPLLRAGPCQYLIQTPEPTDTTAGGLKLPEVSKPKYHHGIVLAAGKGADETLEGALAWWAPHAEIEIEHVGNDGLPDGRRYVAVHHEAIVATRAVPTMHLNAILAPRAIAPDRVKESENRKRVEAQ